MTTKYVWSGAGGTASGDDWTNAYTTLAAAVTAGADLIKVASIHSESLGSTDTTYTFTVNTQIISVDKASSDAPTAGAIIGSQSGSTASIILTGAFQVYCYGVYWKVGAHSTNDSIFLTNLDGGHMEFEACWFYINTTSTSGRLYLTGTAAAQGNAYTKLIGCTVSFSSTSHKIALRGGAVDLIGCTIDDAGSAPATLFDILYNGPESVFDGCDFSKIGSGTLFGDAAGGAQHNFTLRNCKFGSGMTPLATHTGVLNKGGISITAYNCSSGDTHYSFYHGDAFGSTTAVTTYVADDGAQTNSVAVAYQVVTTANCSYYTPYVGPLIAKARTTTGAFTPSFEGLWVNAAGGATIDNDEIWGEWSFQGVSGYSQAEFYNDRMALLGSPADQASAKTDTDWTGDPTAADAGDTTFKLDPGSITNDEVGFVYGRWVVGEPNLTTLFIDPQIRIA